jgi:dTDP-4-amino-4,6-dideoxygalactose transaminase
MNIPLVDLKAQYDSIREEIDEAIRKVIETGAFILGPEVEALEDEIAAYLGVRYAVGVASGTEALRLALLACGIKPGRQGDNHTLHLHRHCRSHNPMWRHPCFR